MSALEQSSNELDRLLNELQQEKGTLHSEYHHYQQTSSTSGGQNLTQQRLPPHPPPSVGSAAYFPLERGHGSLFAIPPPHGNPRSSSSQARYTTRITRDHHQKANSPITLKLDASGLQDNTFKKSQEIKTVSVTNREKRLVDELLQARQEIAQLKRTTSLMDHPIYSSNPPPNVETTWNSSSYSKRMEMKQQPGSISDFQRLHETERQRHDSVGFGKQNENGQGTLSYKKSIITSDGTKVDLFSENKYTGSYVGTALSSPRSVRRATHLHGAGSTFSKKSSQHQSLSESQTTEKKSQSTTSATPSHISPNTLQQQSGKEVTTFDRSLAFHRSVRNRSPQPLSVFLANLHSTSNEMNSILENGTIQRKTLTSGEQTIPVVRVNKSADEVMNEPSRGRPLMDSRSSIPPLNNYNNGDGNGNGNSTVTGNGLNRNGGGGPPNNTQALPLSRITTNGSMTTPMATQNQQSYGKEESIAGGEVTEYKKTTTIKKMQNRGKKNKNTPEIPPPKPEKKSKKKANPKNSEKDPLSWLPRRPVQRPNFPTAYPLDEILSTFQPAPLDQEEVSVEKNRRVQHAPPNSTPSPDQLRKFANNDTLDDKRPEDKQKYPVPLVSFPDLPNFNKLNSDENVNQTSNKKVMAAYETSSTAMKVENNNENEDSNILVRPNRKVQSAITSDAPIPAQPSSVPEKQIMKPQPQTRQRQAPPLSDDVPQFNPSRRKIYFLPIDVPQREIELRERPPLASVIHTDSLPFSVTQSSTHVAPPLPLPSSSILSLPPPAPPQPAFSFSNFVDQESSTFERRIEQPTTNYSAHQENMRVQQQQQQSQQQLIQQHTSSEQRYVEHPSEVFEEIETITLQPIGKGVQDLESSKSATMPRTPGAATPMSHRGDNASPGFATLPSGGGRFNQQQFSSSTTHMSTMQRGHHQQYGTLNNSINTLGSKSHQRAGISRQNSAYDRQVSEDIAHRHQTSHNVAQTPVGQHLLTAPNAHSRSVSVSSFTEAHVTDSTYQNTLRHVQDTSKHWYLPTISREEAINQLKYQVPGSFIVRDSTSFANAFGLAVKVAALPPRVTLKTNDLQSELVRHYLIEPVGNRYVRLKGFEQEPVFPTLAALIHHHVHNALALPVRLVLPNTVGQGYSNLSGTADYVGVEQILTPASPTTQASFPFSHQDMQQTYMSSNHVESSPLTAAYLETHQQMTPQIMQSNTLTAVSNAYSTSTYEVLYLGSYDVDFTEGHKAVKVAIDHVLRYVYTNGKHVDCQMELSAMEGITLVDIKKRLFMKRNFPPNLISYCGFDPKNREYSIYQERKPTKSSMGKISCFDNLFRPIETKSHRVFAFIVRKAGPTGVSHHEGTCYVLAEAGLSQSAALIVKDVLRTLQSQQISSSTMYVEPVRPMTAS